MAKTADSVKAGPAPALAAKPLGLIDKTRLLAAAVVAVVLMRTVGWMVAAPLDPEMAVTLAFPASRIVTVVLPMLVLVVVTSAVGTVIAGARLPEGGVCAAGVGLVGLALKGGSMEMLLAYHTSAEAAGRRALMIAMELDLVLWSLVMLAAWAAGAMTWRWLWPELAHRREQAAAASRGASKQGEGLLRSYSASGVWKSLVVTTVVALFVIWMTIARTPVAVIARGQIIASVAVGLYLGAMAGRYFTGVDAPQGYALAPAAVGFVGYLMGYLSANMSWAKGPLAVYGWLATTPPHALARPLPVEYVAVGLAAVLIGFWGGETVEQTVEEGRS